MKYPILFIAITASLIWGVISSTSPNRFILIWPALNTSILAIAYILNKPTFIAGKQKNGKINYFLLIINAPWLVLSWLTWILIYFISKENKVDKVNGTNWFISSYPGLRYKENDYQLIVDLTSEFPRPINHGSNYICFPNLDGVPLSNLPESLSINPESKVLVHCAQGHGRSATWSSIALTKLGIFPNTKSAYSAIKASRPGAVASTKQEQQLNAI